MTILFAGGEMGSFSPSDSTVVEDTGSHHNTSFARCSIKIPLPGAYALSPVLTSTTSGWLHFDQDMATGGSDLSYVTAFELLTSAGAARIRMQTDVDVGGVKMEYWNGSAWTAAGSTITGVDLASIQTFDVSWTVNSGTGSIALYIAGTERITSGSIDLSGIANIAQVKFYGRAGAATERFISQVIFANESTIGMRLMTGYASGAGSDSAWGSGTYASIDEAVYNDVDFIASSTNAQVSTFAMTLNSAVTGYTVQAVVATARAKKGATGPANLQLAVRASSTNYFSASKALTTGYAPYVEVWETNPATAIAWTVAEATAAQFGVKAIT